MDKFKVENSSISCDQFHKIVLRMVKHKFKEYLDEGKKKAFSFISLFSGEKNDSSKAERIFFAELMFCDATGSNDILTAFIKKGISEEHKDKFFEIYDLFRLVGKKNKSSHENHWVRNAKKKFNSNFGRTCKLCFTCLCNYVCLLFKSVLDKKSKEKKKLKLTDMHPVVIECLFPYNCTRLSLCASYCHLHCHSLQLFMHEVENPIFKIRKLLSCVNLTEHKSAGSYCYHMEFGKLVYDTKTKRKMKANPLVKEVKNICNQIKGEMNIVCSGKESTGKCSTSTFAHAMSLLFVKYNIFLQKMEHLSLCTLMHKNTCSVKIIVNKNQRVRYITGDFSEEGSGEKEEYYSSSSSDESSSSEEESDYSSLSDETSSSSSDDEDSTPVISRRCSEDEMDVDDREDETASSTLVLGTQKTPCNLTEDVIFNEGFLVDTDNSEESMDLLFDMTEDPFKGKRKRGMDDDFLFRDSQKNKFGHEGADLFLTGSLDAVCFDHNDLEKLFPTVLENHIGLGDIDNHNTPLLPDLLFNDDSLLIQDL